MVLELCAACGEEHEPPRGVKCKRTRLASMSVKRECVEMTDSQESGQESVAEQPKTTRRSGRSLRGTRGGRVKAVVKVEQDGEEHRSRRRLERRERARRKIERRAALEDETETGDESAEGAVGGAARSKEGRPRGKEEKDGGSSTDWSDSSSSDTSDSSDSEAERKRRSRRRAKKHRKRKRSKFDLNKFTKNDKSVKKLTVLELLFAALVWGMRRAERVGMTMKEVRGYMGHLSYMVMHAMTGAYTDAAYREYDKAVRRKVKEQGLKHFKQGDQELSLLYFNLDNVRNVRDMRRQGRYTGTVRHAEGYVKQSGPCYAFNYDKVGCAAKKCSWEHVCIACRSSEHAIKVCPRKRY